MGDRGLHTSIWALNPNGDAQYFRRSGDWICPSCGFSNFQQRIECFQCSFTATSAGPGAGAVGVNGCEPTDMMQSPQDLDHHSDKGGDDEVTRSGSQLHNTSGLIEDLARHTTKVKNERTGLSTSRWAPRNYSGGLKTLDGGEVWTKVRLEGTDSNQQLTLGVGRSFQWSTIYPIPAQTTRPLQPPALRTSASPTKYSTISSQ